ncbi:MAG TPA: hypothetical protein VF079_07020 [Sphingomicrobium sp.]
MNRYVAFMILGAPFLIGACQSSEDDPARNPPISVQDVGSRISHHAERKMAELGLSTAEANSCFEKLNADMDAHPDVSLAKVADSDRARLIKIEVYEKAFLDKCFAELRSH